MFLLGPALLELSARRNLTQLYTIYGQPALAAATSNPGLLAILDQHMAAVRDILDVGISEKKTSHTVLLAGYLRGILDQSRELGSAPATFGITTPKSPLNWTNPNWLQLRLASIGLNAKPHTQPIHGEAINSERSITRRR
jgi:uncharacterized protein DUF6401